MTIKQKWNQFKNTVLKGNRRIVLAGGCFWGVEEYFSRLKGVEMTSVGYVNGNIKNPTYEDVCNMRATHAEACEIYYKPGVMELVILLEHMFRFIDPTSLNKQGHDEGLQYRTGIYYQKKRDLDIIQNYLQMKQKDYQQKIVVAVEKEQNYYFAEDYHQDYLKKNPKGYCHVNLNLIKDHEKKEI